MGVSVGFSSTHLPILPTPRERGFSFKTTLTDPSGRLSSWTGLTSLKYLNLGFVKLDSAGTDWLQALNKLSALVELRLHWCKLQVPLSLPFINFTSLSVLDLSENSFNSEIPEWPNNLVFLDLSSNSLEGELPESLGNLKNLKFLVLSGNFFWGSIPSSIGSLSSLKTLDLSYNRMNGTIPESFSQLSELVHADLMENSWTGILSEAHMMKLGRLEYVTITTEPTGYLVFNVSYKWVPPFRLKFFHFDNCLVGPFFPVWLQVQSELASVSLRNAGISDTIPGDWFSKLSSQITYLILSNNQIQGKLPHHLEFPNLRALDLGSNHFEGPFPVWSTNASEIFLQDNLFSGSLPENIGSLMTRLQKLYLSWNRLDGKVPSSMCELEGLQVLSLRSNKLYGQLPNCWHKSRMLWGIDMSNNTLTGSIPSSFGSLASLSVLMLNINNLDGEIPSSLQNCTGLTSIDLGGNRFSGNLPLWIEKFSSFFMLRLQSNLFSGNIPPSLCNLRNLHILDLSHNMFSGDIPRCIGNLSGLVFGNNTEVFERLIYVVMKGRDPEHVFFQLFDDIKEMIGA
ncbi:hypothetical protein Pint_11791 [Pistacia integerrima]|uniref:Uncharacterized protein n=1 Tax=Pistacia integerrima TaxID=434235 RepID=A0ACC0XIE9_9ROSI|nr:hypothetical protein Pint_11791 [Pistacia integerrima]